MITLYGHPYSLNVRKVHVALEEIGATYEYKTVDLTQKAQKHPDYLKLNPNGRVPTIDDDGFILWESNAILWYVADKYGQGKLVPTDYKQRALVDQWMWWQYSDLGPACGKPWIMKFYARVAGKKYDEEEHAKLVLGAVKPLKLLDEHLKERKYVVAEMFSIADIALSESVLLCEEAAISLEPFTHLRDWIGRINERPSYQKTRPPRA